MAEWQSVMTQPEYLAWREFYKLFPFDDRHRFHRPAALISTALGGGDIATRLDWLEPDPLPGDFSAADLQTIKGLGVRPPRKGA